MSKKMGPREWGRWSARAEEELDLELDIHRFKPQQLCLISVMVLGKSLCYFELRFFSGRKQITITSL